MKYATKQTAVIAAALLLLASWVYPPKYYVTHYGHGYKDTSHSFGFLFSGSPERIDFERLFLLDLLIISLGAGAAYFAENQKTKP